MTDTKTCTYQSCIKIFSRPEKMPKWKWNKIKRCPECRLRAHRNRPVGSNQPETSLGRYEVKSEIIDRFLYTNPRGYNVTS